jgi:Domain of unknown function (DUF4375)
MRLTRSGIEPAIHSRLSTSRAIGRFRQSSVHGQVMNGGLASAMEYQSPEAIESAMAGFGYFGRDELGQILREALEVAFPGGPVADVEVREEHMLALDAASYERLEDLEGAYNTLVPRDEVLMQMFREHLQASPRDFVPLG